MKRGIMSKFAAVAAAMTAATTFAGTVAWFHFDEKEPGFAFSSNGSGIVTNACNTATPVHPYVTEGQNATSSPLEWMPRYSTAHRGVSLYDPVSGQKTTNLASMQFVTGTKSGESGSYYGSFLKVPGTDKSALHDRRNVQHLCADLRQAQQFPDRGIMGDVHDAGRETRGSPYDKRIDFVKNYRKFCIWVWPGHGHQRRELASRGHDIRQDDRQLHRLC